VFKTNVSVYNYMYCWEL